MRAYPMRNVEITSITGPEIGGIFAAHCAHCKKTVFFYSSWGKKPDDGDYYLLTGTCVDDELAVQHNLYAQFDFPNPNRFGPRPEEWTPEAYKAYWNPRGVTP